MKFYRVNSTTCFNVNDKMDIIACMGELASDIKSIDILDNGIVIGYIGEQGVTLGQLKDD